MALTLSPGTFCRKGLPHYSVVVGIFYWTVVGKESQAFSEVEYMKGPGRPLATSAKMDKKKGQQFIQVKELTSFAKWTLLRM